MHKTAMHPGLVLVHKQAKRLIEGRKLVSPGQQAGMSLPVSPDTLVSGASDKNHKLFPDTHRIIYHEN